MTVSLEEAYYLYYRRILNYFRSRVDTVMDAEDLTSDVFLKSVQKGVTDLPWLYAVAHDRLVDHYREYKPLLVKEFYLEGAWAGFEKREVRDDARNAFGKLTSRQQQVVHCRLLDYSYGQISTMTGASVGALKSRHNRAVARMREMTG